jgi:hypothetical protein
MCVERTEDRQSNAARYDHQGLSKEKSARRIKGIEREVGEGIEQKRKKRGKDAITQSSERSTHMFATR